MKWTENEPGQAAVAWHSLSNLAYLLRPDARGFIWDLLNFVEVTPTRTEQALQAAAALSFGAFHMITRNAVHYKNSPVSAISPAQFLAMVKF